MGSCTSCGHQLGVGRYCTNCGAPVDPFATGAPPVSRPVATPVTPSDWRTDTAERRLPSAADPRTPPAAVAPPPPPRYPLYADEVLGYTPYGPLTTPTAAPVLPPEPPPELPPGEPEYEPFDYQYEPERRSPVLWILVTVLVLVLVAAGWWFLVRDDGGDDTADDQGSPASAASAGSGSGGVDVAGHASAKAPKTAPPNEDVNGEQVSYDASNMLDGVPETAWRTPGDASGMSLKFTLREPTKLHQVGLVNGYAKTSTDSEGRTFDWYLGNRRITEVIWAFGDGTKVREQLEETRDLQMVDVPDVVTGKVVLKIVKVSKPGSGSASRDFTAISEVSLVGEPG